MRHTFVLPLLLFLFAALVCPLKARAKAPVIPCHMKTEFPHDKGTSTQGLFFHDGKFYESSGGYNASFLAEVDPKTGRHLLTVKIDPNHFAEGIALYGNNIRLLTWQSGVGYVFKLTDLKPVSRFAYRKTFETEEGWGLTFDSKQFFLSSGTARIRLHDPKTFDLIGTIGVTDGETPISQLNELEYVNGLIYANIWKSDRVAIIDPATGQVKAWLDLAPLRSRINKNCGVANGIAYDAKDKRLFVTGKHWNKLFEIEVPELR